MILNISVALPTHSPKYWDSFKPNRAKSGLNGSHKKLATWRDFLNTENIGQVKTYTMGRTGRNCPVFGIGSTNFANGQITSPKPSIWTLENEKIAKVKLEFVYLIITLKLEFVHEKMATSFK